MKRYTFAVGDIHGRLDLLERSADAVADWLAERGAVGQVVFLGDYVDRGPDSRAVVEYLMTELGGAATCLRGNHEQIMLDACAADHVSSEMDMWVMNGGYATLASYGGRREDVPQSHLDWLAGLPILAQDDHRIFVHAGLMPGVPVEEQDEFTCLWIRERFLRDTEGFGKHVVHGHTHTWDGKETGLAELLPHRTNLDTCAYHTGRLSVAVFDADAPGGPVGLLTVTEDGSQYLSCVGEVQRSETTEHKEDGPA